MWPGRGTVLQPLPGPLHSTLGLEAPDRVQESQAKMLRAELCGWIKERGAPAERSCPKKGQEELGQMLSPCRVPRACGPVLLPAWQTLSPVGTPEWLCPGPIQPPDPADMPTQAWSLDRAGLTPLPSRVQAEPPGPSPACLWPARHGWPSADLSPTSLAHSMAVGGQPGAAFRPQLWPHLLGALQSLRSFTVTR